jgi:phage shock protein PspC (stress-responsive transcriptional regulator)
MLGGVCAGLSYSTGIDVTIVRIFALASFFLGGWGAVLYVLLWWLAPEYDKVPEDYIR